MWRKMLSAPVKLIHQFAAWCAILPSLVLAIVAVVVAVLGMLTLIVGSVLAGLFAAIWFFLIRSVARGLHVFATWIDGEYEGAPNAIATATDVVQRVAEGSGTGDLSDIYAEVANKVVPSGRSV